MSSQEQNAKLFQKVVVFRFMEYDMYEPKDILVNRQAVAQYDVRRRCGHYLYSPEVLLTWPLDRLQ